MSRSRNLKPGFFKNEDLAELPFEVRILYQGLWCLADREGRLEDRHKRIKAEIFPYDDSVEVNVGLSMLADSGFIHRYEVDGCPYIQVLTFHKHQNPHCKETASTIPAPYKHGASPEITGTSPADSLDSDSLDLIVGKCAAAPPRKRGKQPKVSMPDGFALSDRVKAWAAEKGYGRLDLHLESFRAKVQAHGYTYADWDAAFMEAVRNDWAKLPPQTPSAIPRGKPAGPSETPLEGAVAYARHQHHCGQIDETERDRLISAATEKYRRAA